MEERPLPPELGRLTRLERKYAAPFYSKWMALFMADRPDQEADNNRRALNGAFAIAGRLWFMPAILLFWPGVIIWSVSR